MPAAKAVHPWSRVVPRRTMNQTGLIESLRKFGSRRLRCSDGEPSGSPTIQLRKSREEKMKLTEREFDKLLIYMMADVALKRKAKGLKLNYPEAVAVISAAALDGARAGSTIEEVAKDATAALTKADVMDGVADMIPVLQVEAVFTDGSRLVTVHTPIQ